MGSGECYVAYYRVSTVKQGRSGLGLDAQRHAVSRYLAGVGGQAEAEFIEVESGRRKDRRQLQLAIARARSTKATLIIAKLDRLARNLSFISALMESGVQFVCCDMPSANPFTLHVMGAMAEQEGRMISERTKAALAEARRRGVRLGNPRLAEVRGNPVAASKANQEQAKSRARMLLGLVTQAKAEGATTLAGIAAYLNQAGALTPRGMEWRPSSVSRLLNYLGL